MKPPCIHNPDTGRLILSKFVNAFRSPVFTHTSDDICHSNTNLSLEEFIDFLPEYCSLKHKSQCTKCSPLLELAKAIRDKGFMLLNEAFKFFFPNTSYHSHHAKSKILRIPLVALRLHKPQSGVASIILLEHCQEFNYSVVLNLLNAYAAKAKTAQTISREQLKDILRMAKGDKERQCIRYTAFLASGMSSSGARKVLGLEKMNKKAEDFEAAITERKHICEAISSISKVERQKLLQEYGISLSDLELDSSSQSGMNDTSTSLSSSDHENEDEVNSSSSPVIHFDIIDIIKNSKFNWFDLVAQIGEAAEEHLDFICNSVSEAERNLVLQSHAAYQAYQRIDVPEIQQEEAVDRGEIVSESDSSNPDDCLQMKVSEWVKKRIKAIQRKKRRQVEKAVAERRLLCRKRSSKLKGIIYKYPNIGKVMEEYVEQRSVGADAWRRTGVLTFDGNKEVKEKVTFKRIHEHLQNVYNRKFGYGTVVQLCIARNRRHRSAARYKGVAQITCRRARKGFSLKFNPDTHWSAALYRGLNLLQYSDGTDILNLNRDDAAGFRLDTLQSHRLHKSPMVKNHEVLGTYTDYVNSYPSILQTTSYNFAATSNTPELCAGVVKAAGVYKKNPAQHFADLHMLEQEEGLQGAFLNPVTGTPKLIECVRVDGAGDEGPSHLEVQFWWTLRHLQKPTLVTLVTARNSGSSHLNRVELQNGCLTLAHSNLFIPSNLNGSCFDPDTGKVDPSRLKTNMDIATNIYMSRVNNAPCGGTKIQLFKGADSASFQKLRDSVLVFLKGSKAEKLKLKETQFDHWKLINNVWDVRADHSIPGFPSQYIFFLKCCFSLNCKHPLCIKMHESSKTKLPTHWFPGGPPLDYIPIPIPDPNHLWGSQRCLKCSENRTCYGHFLSPSEALKSNLPSMSQPPSEYLKNSFSKLANELSSTFAEQLGRATLLSPSEIEIWFKHHQTVKLNRKRGARKAAATRAARTHVLSQSKPSQYQCICGKLYSESTVEVEDWIGCDKCDSWNHFKCVGVTFENPPEEYICPNCRM